MMKLPLCGLVKHKREMVLADRTPTLDLKRIPVHEISAEPVITQKLLEDAGYNVEEWLNRKVADKFARTENNSFINGNGVHRPRGILTYPNWTGTEYQVNAIQQINSGTNGHLFNRDDTVNGINGTADALIRLQYSLKAPYQMNAAWLMSRETFGAVMLLKDADGNYIFNRNLDMNTGMAFSLLNRPVYIMNDMPNANNGATAGETGALAIAYGDFMDGYMIVDRRNINILKDPFTRKPYIKFYTTTRVGGDVCNFESFKLLALRAN